MNHEYLKDFFPNIKKNDLEDFKKHGIFCEKLSCTILNKILDLNFFNKDRADFYKKNKNLLIISANLHDIGHLIKSSKPHNKIGAKFIIENKIYSLSDMENDIVANIIRYHRGKLPNKKHKKYSSFGKENKKMIKFFAGILRIADVFDYNHLEICEIINMEENIKTKTLTIIVNYNLYNDTGFMQIFKKKKELFEKTIKRKIAIKII